MSSKASKIKKNINEQMLDEVDYRATATIMGSIIRTVAILADKTIKEEKNLFDKLEKEITESTSIIKLFNRVCKEFDYEVDEEIKSSVILLHNNNRNTPLVTLMVNSLAAPLTTAGYEFGLIAKYNAEVRLLGYSETVFCEHFLVDGDDNE